MRTQISRLTNCFEEELPPSMVALKRRGVRNSCHLYYVVSTLFPWPLHSSTPTCNWKAHNWSARWPRRLYCASWIKSCRMPNPWTVNR